MAFTPKQQNWRWYANNAAEPSTALADENTAPVVLTSTAIIRLRFTIAETGGTAGSGAVTLEYSFDDTTWYAFGAAAQWNYANGAAAEGGTTTGFLTTDADTHGLYHENATRSETWAIAAARELDFAIVPIAGILTLGTVYFRAKIAGAEVVLNGGEAHPSITLTATELSVSKANLYSVLNVPVGVVVSKANIYSVLAGVIHLHVSKANLYAVIQDASPTGPTQAQLMRHGTWFGSGVKQRMWWAK